MKIKLPLGAIVFALIWALAAFLPSVREAGRLIGALAQGNPLPPPKLAQIRNASTNPVAVAWKSESEFMTRLNGWGEILHRLDALSAQYPDQLWIRATRLRLTNVRHFGSPSAPTSAAQNQQELRNLSVEAANIAQQTAQHEPDNAFWSWIEATLRFDLGQKEQGLAAVERASRATHLEDYAQSTARARLQWWEQHDNPSWEERFYVPFETTYPQYVSQRNVTAAASKEAGRAYRQGDKKRAIQISAALLRANEISARDSRLSVGSLIAQECGRVTLQNLFGVNPPSYKYYEERQRITKELRGRWIALCKSTNRSDVASRADWVIQDIDMEARNQYYGGLWQQNGLKAPWGVVAVFVPIGLFGLAAWCFLLAAVWVWGALASRRSPQNDSPTRGQITACANFAFWSFASVWIVAFSYKDGTPLSVLTPNFWQSSVFSGSGVLLFVVLFALTSWLLPVFFTSWKRGRRFRWVRPEKEARALGRKFGLVRVVAWLVFLAFTAVVASNGRGLWDDTLLQLPISASIALISFCAVLTLEIIRFNRAGRGLPRLRLEGPKPPSPGPRVWKWARNGARIIALVGFYCAFLGLNADWPPALGAVGLPVGLVAAVAAWVFGRKVKGDGFAFRLATRSAGVLSLAWSLTFLALALASWPLRVELNHQLDRRLSMTEMDWMREQVAKNSSP